MKTGYSPGDALYSFNSLGEPPTFIQDTQQTVTSVLPDPDPWNSLSWYYDPQRRNPRSHQWNLEIQHQVTANLSATLGYVGSHNDRVPLTGVANTPMEAGPGTPEDRRQQRPYPYMTTPWYETDLGIANYNALQFRLERRFADGVEFLLSYTWSKALDNGSSGWYGVESGVGSSSAIQNFYDLKGNYAVSGYDVPHFLSLSSVWELPFGKGKRWLKHGPASWLLGDWQVNSIVQLRSGQPFNLSAPGDVANLNNDIGWWNYARPNLVGDPNPGQRTSQMWYNPDAFEVPVLSFGNFGRNVLRTASVYNADLSLFKNISLGEARKLEVRSEFFNVFNIMSLGAPVEVIGQPDSGRVNALVNRPRQIQFSLRFVF